MNKSRIATESLLQIAVEKAIDIIAVQEPWLVPGEDYLTTRTINHQSYLQLLPELPEPTIRPRVLFYISRSLRASVSPFTQPDPDFLAVTVLNHSFNIRIFNIYNQDSPSFPTKAVERNLLPTPLPKPSLLLGDFNLHHPLWDPDTTGSSREADDLHDWIEENNLHLLNTPGTGTFFRANMNRESVLDLSLATDNLANRIEDWQIIPAIGSDHHAISLTVRPSNADLVESPLAQIRFNTKKARWEDFATALQDALADLDLELSLQNLPAPSHDTSMALMQGRLPDLAQRLDQLAKQFTDAMVRACQRSMSTIQLGAKSKPWWSEELLELRREMVSRQRQYLQEQVAGACDAYLWKRQYLLARNAYFEAIKKAKKDHWNRFLEGNSPQTIFRAMAYTKDLRISRIPGIQSRDGNVQETFQGKLLHGVHLLE